MENDRTQRRPDVAAVIKRTRTDKGLPDGIVDPTVLARVATIVGDAARRDAA